MQQQQPRTDDADDDVDDDVATYQLTLKCLTEGQPAPSVEWLQNYVRSVHRKIMTYPLFMPTIFGPLSPFPPPVLSHVFDCLYSQLCNIGFVQYIGLKLTYYSKEAVAYLGGNLSMLISALKVCTNFVF